MQLSSEPCYPAGESLVAKGCAMEGLLVHDAHETMLNQKAVKSRRLAYRSPIRLDEGHHL